MSLEDKIKARAASAGIDPAKVSVAVVGAPEKMEDVLAELRASLDLTAAMGRPMSVGTLRRYIDRLEAAHKRELSKNTSKNGADFGQLGDAAKLREALRECAQYIACVGGIGVGEVTINDNVHLIPEELTQKAIAALSAPPRNCDVGTAQEQDERFHRFCVKHHTGSCAGCHNPVGDYTVANGVRECALVWAQMPYEEGGAQ